MSQSRISPAEENPRYWQYDGEQTVLLGGSSEDNLFQISGLIDELDALADAGGNYVRNTLSSREDFAVWPFEEVEAGVYDLDTWNEEYWQRLEKFLEATYERDIIAQFELWAFHDFYPPWSENPWNPRNNVTYDETETGLSATDYGSYWETKHDFFLSVTNEDTVLLDYQQQFVDRVLDLSFDFDNVLYCMTNEIFSQYPPEWGYYWADYVKDAADDADVDVEVAEMYQESDLRHEQHKATLDHPEQFDFVDASQNSGQSRDTHWDRLQFVRDYLADDPRPINHTKTYGGETNWTDGPEHGIQRFWRNVIGGAASTRFHRPPSGIGANDRALRHIASARALVDALDIVGAEPDADHGRLADRSPNEAFLTAVEGEQYAVYFPDGGNLELDLTDTEGTFDVQWLHVEGTNWQTSSPEQVDGGQHVSLETPRLGHWVALLTAT